MFVDNSIFTKVAIGGHPEYFPNGDNGGLPQDDKGGLPEVRKNKKKGSPEIEETFKKIKDATKKHVNNGVDKVRAGWQKTPTWAKGVGAGVVGATALYGVGKALFGGSPDSEKTAGLGNWAKNILNNVRGTVHNAKTFYGTGRQLKGVQNQLKKDYALLKGLD